MIQIDIELPNYAYECLLNDGETGLCNILGKGCYKRRYDCPLKEVKPKHGQWLSIKVMDDEADFGETDGAECSVCGYTTNSEYWAKTYYHYCPNCGSRMDEESDTDENWYSDEYRRIGEDERDEVENET